MLSQLLDLCTPRLAASLRGGNACSGGSQQFKHPFLLEADTLKVFLPSLLITAVLSWSFCLCISLSLSHCILKIGPCLLITILPVIESSAWHKVGAMNSFLTTCFLSLTSVEILQDFNKCPVGSEDRCDLTTGCDSAWAQPMHLWQHRRLPTPATVSPQLPHLALPRWHPRSCCTEQSL